MREEVTAQYQATEVFSILILKQSVLGYGGAPYQAAEAVSIRMK